MQSILPTTKNKILALSLDQKIQLSYSLIDRIYNNISVDQLGLAWTGGKDSTLMLWLVREYCKRENNKLPKIFFIDEGDIFPEVFEFTQQLSKKWCFKFEITHNTDVSKQVKKVGDTIKVSKLNKLNKAALKDLGYTKKTFPYEPESMVGNHLMKTVACNAWLNKNEVKGLFVGVRWDEQEDRGKDAYIRKVAIPNHVRIEPILHFSEQEIWDITHRNNIPAVSLYAKGYRSLGAKTTTSKVSDEPAWEQDLITTTERAGRHQDKEKIMKRLRDLGYM